MPAEPQGAATSFIPTLGFFHFGTLQIRDIGTLVLYRRIFLPGTLDAFEEYLNRPARLGPVPSRNSSHS